MVFGLMSKMNVLVMKQSSKFGQMNGSESILPNLKYLNLASNNLSDKIFDTFFRLIKAHSQRGSSSTSIN